MNFLARIGWAWAAGVAVVATGVVSAQPAPPAEISAPAGAGPTFGRSVAIDGTTLVIGAPDESAAGAGAGAAYVYQFRQGGWTRVARLAPGTLLPGDEFGHAVAIQGSTIVVGAPGDDIVRNAAGAVVSTVSNKGAAYVFERVGGAWSFVVRLDHADASDQPVVQPTIEDRFGFAVGVGDDVVMVGAPLFDGRRDQPLGGVDQGAVAIFERRSAGWTIDTWLMLTTFGRPAHFAGFGRSIALRDRDAAVGSVGTQAGVGYVYRVTKPGGTWTTGSVLGRWSTDTSTPTDGLGFDATFLDVSHLFATNTHVVVNDQASIRSVTTAGVVSTIAPLPADKTRVFESPTAFVSAANGKQLFRGDLAGTETFIAGNSTFGLVDGTGTSAGFGTIAAVAPDGQGDYYVADVAAIRKVTAGGVVTTVAGVPTVIGSDDGPPGVGRLGIAHVLTYDAAAQRLYIIDRTSVRVMAADGTLTTLAGVPTAAGFADGSGATARFRNIRASALAPDGSLMVADGSTLRRVTAAGAVSTVLGVDGPESLLTVDGPQATARMGRPTALAFAPNGTLLVADGATIRRVSTALDVVTLAGRPGLTSPYAPSAAVALGDEWWAGAGPQSDTPLQSVALAAGAAWVGRRWNPPNPAPAMAPPSAIDFGAAMAFSGDGLFVSDVSAGAAAGRPVVALAFDVDRWRQDYLLQPADLAAHPQFGASLAGSARLVAVGAPKEGAAGSPSGSVFVFDIDTVDGDGDGLPDGWERRFGLDPSSSTAADGAAGDPDGDGVTNAAELAAQTHPRGVPGATRYFAEGARSAFFATQFSIANPEGTAANVLLRYAGPDGTVVAVPTTVPARASRRIDVPLGAVAEFATRVESDVPVVVDRVMSWSAGSPYGSHGERALTAASTEWYFAEGATHSGFDLFYLLYNPSDAPASVRVRYLRGSGGPLEKTYEVGAGQRFNIWVDLEIFEGQTRLAEADVSARIDVLNGVPIIAERAMYRSTPNVAASTPGALFAAGHESAGVTAPSTSWFFAEGATNDFFDLFVLVANPSDAPSTVRARFLLGDGRTFTKDYVVQGNSRFNIWVDQETFGGTPGTPLANAGGLSTTLDVISGPAIVAERAMWWPGPTAATWAEAHNSPGATVTAARWVAAAGHVAAVPEVTDTYYLLANPGPTAATVTLTLLFEGGRPEASRTFTVPASTRFTVNVGAEFPQTGDSPHFSALFETAPTTPIVVEWAIYRNAAGAQWAAGASALATPIP